MKTILLLRADLSNPNSPPADDLHHPISRRVQMDALRIGTIVQERELYPEIILTSPALRARQTVELIRRNSGYAGDVLFIDELYRASCQQILELISHLPNRLGRVMIVGHTPGLKQVLTTLTGWDKSFPSTALAYLVTPIHAWQEILELETEAILVELWHPSKPACSYFTGFFELG
jgi:phosphohistidine phosphatase